MKSRLLALCMLFVLLVALVPGAMAQDAVCGNLSGDDCTALTTAFTNTAASSSGAFTLDTTIDIQAEDPSQAVNLTIKADGKFNGVNMAGMTDMSAMSDATAAIASLTEGVKSFSGELNLSIGLPAEAAAMTGGEPLVLNLILVDGVGYIDFSKLPAAIAPYLQQMGIPNSWAGLDLIDTLTNAGGMAASSIEDSGDVLSGTEDLAKIQALVSKHLQYTRSGDTFSGTIDLPGLFSDPEFQALASEGEAASELTPEQTAAIESLKDAKIEVTYTLNGDKIGSITANVSVPGSTLAALDAAGEDSTSEAPTSINITLSMNYTGLGETQTVTAPAGAPVAKFADLMTLVGGMMGGMQ
ncbi:MAG: hypothetical protein LCI00_23255 [Chloroflexi bacterium]|nr:hypothetical protein [Chloroflexota bacterium]MCC6895972.1 hypothetical protein [Anaerolineae bacterium]